jgi:magnesium-transporting ATPase (P-type)
MITGDHAETAREIAASSASPTTRGAHRRTTSTALDDAALRRRHARDDVFARTTPEHKLRLVEALQADGRSSR